jgi:hypothetical protein
MPVRRPEYDTSDTYWALAGPHILSYTWLANRKMYACEKRRDYLSGKYGGDYSGGFLGAICKQVRDLVLVDQRYDITELRRAVDVGGVACLGIYDNPSGGEIQRKIPQGTGPALNVSNDSVDLSVVLGVFLFVLFRCHSRQE